MVYMVGDSLLESQRELNLFLCCLPFYFCRRLFETMTQSCVLEAERHSREEPMVCAVHQDRVSEKRELGQTHHW
jgi:hypothetical protein